MLVKQTKKILLFCAVFSIFFTADAQSIPCGNAGTQSEMNECAASEAKKADKRLNVTYRELLSKIKEDKVATDKIVSAQRAWIAFRDAELAAMWPTASGENPNLKYGSVHPFCYSLAYTEMTEKRTSELRDRITQHPEGDVCSTDLAKCTMRSPSRNSLGQ